MTSWRVIVTLQSPAAIGRRVAHGHFIESLDYLPGGVLRGALAGAALRECSTKQPHSPCAEQTCPLRGASGECHFLTIFAGDRPWRFHNCCPAATEDEVFPLPLTARTCKDFPASTTQQQLHSQRADRKTKALAAIEARSHGVWDALKAQYQQVRSGALEREACHCGANGVRPEQPFAQFGGRTAPWVHLFGAQMLRQTRVAINRRRHTQEDGMLYAVSALEAGQDLRGGISIPAGTPDEARDAFHRLCERGSVILGGGGSRGLGEATVRLSDAAAADPLAERQRAMTEAFDAPADGDLLFSVTLRSDAILADPGGTPHVGIDAATLARRLAELIPSLAPPDLKLLFAEHDHVVVSGWNNSWRLPKWSALATVKGSVYLFAAAVAQADRPLLLTALEALESEGLGYRLEDGFGQVAVCHPFHWEALR